MRYRRRWDIEVEAYQLTRRNIDSVSHLCGGRIHALPVPTSPPSDPLLRLDIPTLEGVKRANLGGWVVRDARMEWDVLTDREFNDQFEEVEEGLAPLIDEDKMHLTAVKAVYEEMAAEVASNGYYYTGMEVGPWLERLRIALGFPYVDKDEDE